MAVLGVTTVLLATPALADDNGVPLHGFIDVQYGQVGTAAPDDQKQQGFALGNIDFYLNPEYDEHIKSLMEIAFEPDGITGQIVVDAERAQVGYVLNDHNTVWVGRFHTPYGVWNTSYHHGAQLQTTINRPRFIDFEDHGGLLAAHSTGIWLHGYSEVGSADRLKYDLFVANGPRITSNGNGSNQLDFNLLKADHASSLVGLNLGYQFREGFMKGWIAGLHGFVTQVNAYASYNYTPLTNPAIAQVGQTMTGGYLTFEGERFNFDSEIYQIADTNRMPGQTGNYTNSLYFIEADYLVTEKLRPFLMFEKTALDSTDPYFTSITDSMSYSRWTGGLRYDLTAAAALKVSYASTMQASSPGLTVAQGAGTCYYDKFALQYALRF
jgi:hypothetical protein